MSGYFSLLLYYLLYKLLYLMQSVDPDQTPSVASDLGLHCLPKSLLWDARLTSFTNRLF